MSLHEYENGIYASLRCELRNQAMITYFVLKEIAINIVFVCHCFITFKSIENILIELIKRCNWSPYLMLEAVKIWMGKNRFRLIPTRQSGCCKLSSSRRLLALILGGFCPALENRFTIWESSWTHFSSWNIWTTLSTAYIACILM